MHAPSSVSATGMETAATGPGGALGPAVGAGTAVAGRRAWESSVGVGVVVARGSRAAALWWSVGWHANSWSDGWPARVEGSARGRMWVWGRGSVGGRCGAARANVHQKVDHKVESGLQQSDGCCTVPSMQTDGAVGHPMERVQETPSLASNCAAWHSAAWPGVGRQPSYRSLHPRHGARSLPWCMAIRRASTRGAAGTPGRALRRCTRHSTLGLDSTSDTHCAARHSTAW